MISRLFPRVRLGHVSRTRIRGEQSSPHPKAGTAQDREQRKAAKAEREPDA
jgi:hypothetical protein